MKDVYGILIVITIALVSCLPVYVFASFSYEVSHDYVKMRRRIFGYIPFSSAKIKIEKIQEVRRYNFRKEFLKELYIFGNLFRGKGVIIILKKRSLPFLTKRIFVSPSDPDKFIEHINSVIGKIRS